jgi:phage tail sheath gpL-like
MPISFNDFPANWRLPLFWLEVDPSKAGFPTLKQPALIVGQKLAAGTAPVDVPFPVSSEAQIIAAAGRGSMLHREVVAFLANNRAHELYCLPVAEPPAGVVASGTIVVTAPPTQAGTLYLYIAGQRLQVPIAATDTVDIVAGMIEDVITATPDLPVTATVATATVTVTCKWKGLTGNDIDMRVNYGGPLAGEIMPAGLTLTVAAKLSAGTGQPNFAAAIAALGEEQYEYVCLPFTDTTSLTQWKTEYEFGDNGRWGWMRQLYGHLFSAYRGTYSELKAWGPTQNSGVLSVMSVEVNSPSPIWEWSAAYTAQAARHLLNDPARPLQTLPLEGILPAPRNQRFLTSERQNLAGTGLATQTTTPDFKVHINRETTTYQLNNYGVGDDAYTDVTTLATLARLFRDLKHMITTKYPRHKLANDGTRFGPGQAIVTPKTIKAEIVAQYRIEEFEGLVEDVRSFKANLIVERNINNPNRLDVLLPPDLVNQLRIFAVLAQFRLQYNRGVDLAVA